MRLPSLALVGCLLCLGMVGGSPTWAAEPAPVPPAETPAQFDARMAWWREARYGMFIHWDMSSVAGTEISWSRKGSKPLDNGKDPAGYVEDPAYDHLYKRFNPTGFDAEAWVKLAKDAGMKYLVFTAKHHGGFCMWDTKLTDYSIMHTPFKRDVLKELADACHKAGMRFGIYYSQRDWYHPDYGIGDNQKYLAYMNGQVRELLTNYGQVDVIWWDSYGRGDLVNFWRLDETFNLVKQLQPQIVMNNRLAVLGGYNRQPVPYRGDHDTPEQRLGSFQNRRPWESCMCLGDMHNWSYRPKAKAKPFSNSLKTLLGCATGDGNLLLDIAPDPQGVIPADQQQVLRELGAWLAKNGESIYGTRGGPYRNGPWGGATYRDRTIYLHIQKWVGDELTLAPLKAKIIQASATFVQTAEGVKITVPAAQRDPLDTIVTLTLDAPVSGEMPDGAPLAAPILPGEASPKP